jgi:hypothetical protein
MASEMEIVVPQERRASLPAVPHEMSVDQLVAQVQKIQDVMSHVMIESNIDKGIEGHYGQIPGTKKKVLLKAGAEKLCVVFRLRPEFESVETWDGAHLTVKSRCTLVHIATEQSFGTGEGMCSTKESKYAYRGDGRVCPECGAGTIKRSKYAPKGAPRGTEPGWYCFGKIGGCGANFDVGDESIASQPEGRIPNPDLADLYNTVLKMANKRAHVAAVLLCTGASDIFTQDLEEAPRAQADQRPKGKPPEEQRDELLSRIYGLLRTSKLTSKAATEDRTRVLSDAFNAVDWDGVKLLDLPSLREGMSRLNAMLAQASHPGDESIDFGDDIRGEPGEE